MQRRRIALLLTTVAALTVIALGGAIGAQAKQDTLGTVHSVTARFNSIQQATKAGYVPFYICAEQPGVGTMGQHLLNGQLLDDPAIDPLRPEVLVYQPTRAGGFRLVAVEYVTFTPGLTVLGQPMNTVPLGNRYGVPAEFYAKHAWIWQGNPLGLFADWNPTVTCLGEGDAGG